MQGCLTERERLETIRAPTRNSPLVHSNRYGLESACEHCEGIIRHERWCITRNVLVAYAYAAVLDPAKLTPGDELILHALGVTWKATCIGNVPPL